MQLLIWLISSALLSLLTKSDNGFPCQVNNCQQCSYYNYCGLCSNNYILTINPTTSQPYCASVLCTDQNCMTCLSDNICQQCTMGYYIDQNGMCVLGQPIVPLTECPSSCLNCTMAHNCLLCGYGYTLMSGHCYNEVPTNQITGCQIAFSPTMCQICQTGMIVNLGYNCMNTNNVTCNVENCMSCYSQQDTCASCLPTFQLTNNNTCQNMQCQVQNCMDCANTTTCSMCSQGYYLVEANNTCLLKSYGCNITWCIVCLGANTCVECQLGYMLNKVLNNGQVLYANCIKLTVNSPQIPYIAKPYCKTFNQFYANSDSTLEYGCIQCWPNFINVGGICVANLNQSSFTCQLQNCIYCVANNYCGACQSGYRVQKMNGGQCIKKYSALPYCVMDSGYSCLECMQGYALNFQGQCVKYSQNVQCMIDGCQYCLDQSNQCMKCMPGYQWTFVQMQEPVMSNRRLLLENDGVDNSTNCTDASDYNCNNDTENKTNNTKRVCEPICSIRNCYQCSSHTLCAVCYGGYQLSASATQCKSKSAISLTVAECRTQFSMQCTICTAQQCTQCMNGYTMDDSGGCCKKAMHNSFGCVMYESLCSQQCYQCEKGYILSDGYCYSIPCTIQNCAYCFQSSTCIICAQGYTLNSQTMLCQTYSLADNSNCSKIQNCVMCNQQSMCIQCENGYVAYQGYCVCNFQNCLACQGSQICTQCPYPTSTNYFLPFAYLFSPVTLFPINTAGCAPKLVLETLCMVDNCFQCYSVNLCAVCTQGYTLLASNTCVQNNCPTNSNCQLCSPNGQLCYLCNTGHVQKNAFGECIQIAIASQYSCQVVGCALCQSSSTCDTCLITYTLTSDKTCSQNQCMEYCQVCFDGDVCLVCDTNYYLTNNATCQKLSTAPQQNFTCNIDKCAECKQINQTNSSTNSNEKVIVCNICQLGFQQSTDQLMCMPQTCLIDNCQFCLSFNHNCIVCQQGYYLNSYLQCLMYIPSIQTSMCTIYNCLTCLNNQHCTLCVSGWLVTQDGLCQTSEYCSISNCVSCTNAQNCTVCAQNYIATASLNSQIAANNDGYFCSPSCGISFCEVCQTFNTCSVCSDTRQLSSEKTGCQCPDSSYIEQNGLCVCPQGQLQYNQSTCIACSLPQCIQCSEGNICSKCTQSFTLLNSQCICPSTYQIISNVCQCPPNTTQFENTCVACEITNCKLCKQPNVCSNCSQSYMLSNQQCICPAGTTEYENYCFVCNMSVVPYCSVCSQQNFCQICQETFVLSSSSTGQCVCPTLTTLYVPSANAGTCIVCNISNCQLCQTSNICKTCAPQYTPNNNLCLSCQISNCLFCQSNNFCGSCTGSLKISSSGDKCISCSISNCDSCSDTNVCASCTEGFQFDTNNQFCVDCSSVEGCSICQNNNQCGVCQTGYILNNGKCLLCSYPCATCNADSTCSTCQQPFSTAASTIGQCYTCAVSNCATCSSTNTSNCTACLSGYRRLSSGSCQRVCTTNLCSSCSDPSICTKCIDGYTTSGSGCKLCTNAPACSSCSTNNVTECLSCSPGYFLINGACSSCPSSNCKQCNKTTCLAFKSTTNQFAIIINQQIVPAICDPGCEKCSVNNPQICTNCLSGYSKTSAGNCIPCVYPCQTCKNNDPSKCLSCDGTAFLSNNMCVVCTQSSNCLTCQSSNLSSCKSCPYGFSYNSTSKVCVSGCPLNCLSCSNSSVCTLCREGYSVNSIGACLPCLANCRGCSGQANGICLNCGSGFFLNNNQVCQVCSSFCQQCSSIGCTTCLTGYTLTNDFKCAANCVAPCASCSVSNPTICQSCVAGYQFDNSTSTCVEIINCAGGVCSVCPLGYILNGGVCLKCQGTDCARCQSNTVTTCSSCKVGFYLSSSNQCTLCPTGCSSCTSQKSCQSCASGYTLPASPVKKSTVCIQCQSPCLECSENPKTCTSCISNFTLSGWQCTSSFNYGFSAVFAVDPAQFYGNYQSFLDSIVSAINATSIDVVSMNIIQKGSTITGGNITTTDAAGSSGSTAQISALNNLFSTNGNIAGMSVQSSSVVVNGGSSDNNDNNDNNNNNGSGSSSVNLALILGICIPVGIIIFAILIYCICFRKSSSPSYGEGQTNNTTGRTIRQQFQLNQMQNTI